MKRKCRVFPTFELLGKKWTLHIIKELSWHGKKRYSELKRALEGVDVIVRIVYPEVPPRVEYDLTDKGQDLSKSIDSICDWARKWYPDEVRKA
jgi:DNA-binding HxlR family transcriptional regulator